jgi:sugar lactone lactonase YvrE
MWMMHCVVVYSPDGKPLKKINFPAKCMTCPTWGGKDNNVLFIASAQPLVEKAAPGDEGGHVFRYQAGVKGMLQYEFAG